MKSWLNHLIRQHCCDDSTTFNVCTIGLIQVTKWNLCQTFQTNVRAQIIQVADALVRRAGEFVQFCMNAMQLHNRAIKFHHIVIFPPKCRTQRLADRWYCNLSLLAPQPSQSIGKPHAELIDSMRPDANHLYINPVFTASWSNVFTQGILSPLNSNRDSVKQADG